MSLAFSSVKKIAIPEGIVKQIAKASDNTVLWKKKSIEICTVKIGSPNQNMANIPLKVWFVNPELGDNRNLFDGYFSSGNPILNEETFDNFDGNYAVLPVMKNSIMVVNTRNSVNALSYDTNAAVLLANITEAEYYSDGYYGHFKVYVITDNVTIGYNP